MKRSARNILDHVWGPMASMIINGLIVFALLTFVTMQSQQEHTISQVKVIKPPEEKVLEELNLEELIDPVETQEINENLEYSLDEPISVDINVDVDPIETSDNNADPTELLSDISSPVTMVGLLSGRNETGRRGALARFGHGMGGSTEPAAIGALEWLRTHQKPDGSWDKDGNISSGSGNAGMTGLALLAFLAHGETPSSAKYGATVEAALRWLLSQQDDRGLFFRSGHQVYGHAMATYAVSEAYAMTKISKLKPAMEKAVQVIMDGQQKTGGYDYNYKLSDRNDSSVGAWQVQAMKAAYMAGASNPGLKEKLDNGVNGLLANSKAMENGSLSFGYTSPGGRPTITAASIVCMQLTGKGKSNQVKNAQRYIADIVPNWQESGIKEHGGAIYYWYYATQAKFHDGPDGQLFKSWNGPMATTLVKNQNKDGSWDSPPGSKGHGKTMETSLAALTLMVYYRHLPTTTLEAVVPHVETVEAGSFQEDDDVRLF